MKRDYRDYLGDIWTAIDEPSKRIHDDLRCKAPEVPWRYMAGMRDRLIHVIHGPKTKIFTGVSGLAG